MGQNKRFGDLLSEGIVSVSRRQSKTIVVVEWEVAQVFGFTSHHIVERWRRGYVPKDSDQVAFLVRYCVTNGRVDRSWASGLLTQARYHGSEALLQEIFRTSSLRIERPTVYHNLPPPYGEFLGREKDKERVMEGLGSRWPLIAIEGMAGIGKTTLAIETAYCCLSGADSDPKQSYEAVAWISAKDRPQQKHWLGEVLDTVARVLSYPAITQMPSEQKRSEIDHLLRKHRTLIIVDNFETIDDHDLVDWIQRVPEPSKALITDRYGQQRRVWDIHLKGLEKPEALELIHYHARRSGLQLIQKAGEEALLPLVGISEGNPKAIEMALGYIKGGRLSLDEVIEHLHRASKSVEGLFDYLFGRAWESMTSDARQVLLVLPYFVNSASKEALGAASGLSEYHLDSALEQLVELALLDIDEAWVTSSLHYSTHPLTRAFANAKLRAVTSFEEQARLRWSKYYRDFAAHCLERERPKEHYWNSLVSHGVTLIDPEWLNLREVLRWADREGQDQFLVELMLLLVHYMDRRLLYGERIYYAGKTAQAAQNLGWKEIEAVFRIDALGWTLIEEGHFLAAEQEIRLGLQIAQQLGIESADGRDLIALTNTFLARVLLEQGYLTEAIASIEQANVMQCRSVIRSRVDLIAGDIAYKQENYAEAIRLYENTLRESREYSDEGEGFESYYRLGLAHLNNGDLTSAEAQFNKILEVEQQHGVTIEVIYAKYGLARLALVRNQHNQARGLAQEALKHLTRSAVSHRLLEQMVELLTSLEID